MINFSGASFNAIYIKALRIAISGAVSVEGSRVGDVINLGQSFIEIAPNDPRLIFLNERRLNGAFAILEGAWVLSGSNSLEPLLEELPHYSNYSDDGVTLAGAYGYRLARFFGVDQVKLAIEALSKGAETRRVVLTMYSPEDITADSKDIPCNTTIYLKIRHGCLDITILNRSNDLYLGVPYNIFVFGLLQRFIARELNIAVGIQRHFSDSLHLYSKDVAAAKRIVQCNREAAAEIISDRFDWSYSTQILDNLHNIFNRSFSAIEGHELREFLTCYSAAGRRSERPFEQPAISGLLGFIGYQFAAGSSRPHSPIQQWEELKEGLKMGSVKERFEDLSTKGSDEIVKEILRYAAMAQGAYGAVSAELTKRKGPISLQAVSNEEEGLRTLLLCAVYSSIDPFVAGSSVGTRYKENIVRAAKSLGIDSSAVYPISSIADDVFQVLEGYLSI